MPCLRTLKTHQIFWCTPSLLYWHNLPHGDNKTSILEVKESILSRLCTPLPPNSRCMLWSAGFLSPTNSDMCIPGMGVAKIFQRGATLCQTEGTHQISMSTSTPRFTYGTKKAYRRGVTGASGPHRTMPSVRCMIWSAGTLSPLYSDM